VVDEARPVLEPDTAEAVQRVAHGVCVRQHVVTFFLLRIWISVSTGMRR
jgi:hypothetical protein